MNTSSIKSLVGAALTAVAAYGKAVEGLKAAYIGQDVAAVRVGLMPHVGAFYGVSVVQSAGKGNAGAGVKLDSGAPKYEAARKALNRLVNDIVGKSAARDEIEVPRAVQAAFSAAWALVAQYQHAGQIAATALATAKAK